ncbi:MAG: hypothetical protein ACYC1A_08435, partial [Spirochaetales bacterium]
MRAKIFKVETFGAFQALQTVRQPQRGGCALGEGSRPSAVVANQIERRGEEIEPIFFPVYPRDIRELKGFDSVVPL